MSETSVLPCPQSVCWDRAHRPGTPDRDTREREREREREPPERSEHWAARRWRDRRGADTGHLAWSPYNTLGSGNVVT